MVRSKLLVTMLFVALQRRLSMAFAVSTAEPSAQKHTPPIGVIVSPSNNNVVLTLLTYTMHPSEGTEHGNKYDEIRNTTSMIFGISSIFYVRTYMQLATRTTLVFDFCHAAMCNSDALQLLHVHRQ